ncbi:MAG: TetR/AcrR family transcriptional regulator [bacterium]|nr:TetR/AcrR family transcriptional regulator [bacterium]
MNTKHHRAKPLPPSERKQAIVDAIIPLLLEKGAAVTSREMADAAGIAEGTIFSVFPDKPSIIKEAVKTSMEPAPVCNALELVPRDAPLRDQLEAAAGILLERNERVAALMGVLHSSLVSASQHRRSGPPRFVRDSNATALAALTELLERHADQLRVAPDRAAIALRGLVFANAHPMAAPEEKTTPSEIVDLLLGGIAAAGASA